MAPPEDVGFDTAHLWDEEASTTAPSQAGDRQVPSATSLPNVAPSRQAGAQQQNTPPHHLLPHMQPSLLRGLPNEENRPKVSGHQSHASRGSNSSAENIPFPARGRPIQGAAGKSSARATSRPNDYSSKQHGRSQSRNQNDQPPRRQYTDPALQPTTGWAKPPSLEKTRQTVAKANAERKEAEINRYLKAPGPNTPFPATGLYLWPKQDIPPAKLLGGPALPQLNIIRTSHYVFIKWDSQKKCLRINSERSEKDITAAIKAIRQAIKSAETMYISSSPLYIIVPPQTDCMRKIVAPKEGRPNGKGKMHLIGTKLVGNALSKEERRKWELTRDRDLKINAKDFEKHLSGVTSKLTNFMQWMRMRVHFGHIVLPKFKTPYANSEFSYAQFVEMMKDSEMNGGLLDRRIDRSFARKIMQRIVESPDLFRAAGVDDFDLQDIKPRHTEIFIIKPPNADGLRLEADIEVIPEPDDSKNGKINIFEAGTGTGQCQIGAVKLFWADKRNKMVDITTVDLESGFDWTFEIIEDGERLDLNDFMRQQAYSSVDGRTILKRDDIGLPFPGVTPKMSVLMSHVKEIVVRSIYSYEFGQGYIVEIAVYRTWKPEVSPDSKGYSWADLMIEFKPRIESSLSMYKREWDWGSDEVHDKTRSRDWDLELKWMFEKDDGISKFLKTTKFFLEFLAEAEQH